jgi:hypothetical protein
VRECGECVNVKLGLRSKCESVESVESVKLG